MKSTELELVEKARCSKTLYGTIVLSLVVGNCWPFDSQVLVCV